VALVALGWLAPAFAAARYAEAPMKVQAEGLTVEEHLQRQVALSHRLAGELPAGVLERAVQVSVSAAEIAAIDQAPRWMSPLKVGVVKPLPSQIQVAGLTRGQLQKTADGGLVWAQAVQTEGAGAVRLHVTGLSLPKNAELYVYSRKGEAFGPYKATGPNRDGDFWTTALFGSEAILQLRFASPVRAADLRAASFRVAEAGLITVQFAGELQENDYGPKLQVGAANWPCGNISCLIDATCSNVGAANPAKNAVAKMEWIQGAFIYTCTGGLLSDNNPAQNNFFLTANHCFSGTKTAKNVDFYWKFATSSCNGTCPSNSGWPYKTTGGSVAASNRKGDFTLGQLNTAPPSGSVFLGWTSAPIANTNGAALHRVSNPDFGPQVYSQHNVDTAAGTCSGWPRGERIYSRDITGATDGGSSGSPVLNASSQVVGQLSGSCGTNPSDACASGPGEANATVDGAFAFYFSSVQPFLNP
jgi:V8-like Glu-specific endopeptidase